MYGFCRHSFVGPFIHARIRPLILVFLQSLIHSIILEEFIRFVGIFYSSNIKLHSDIVTKYTSTTLVFKCTPQLQLVLVRHSMICELLTTTSF